MSVDLVASRILKLGKGTELAKVDIKQAYRLVPVHPADRRRLGVQWQNTVYVDKCLPFGLRSAPILFSAVADAIQGMVQLQGVSFVEHYIDDFITMGTAGTQECAENIRIMHQTCMELGVPVEESKSEGPTPKLQFLGIELDSTAMELRLPPEKLANLLKLLRDWRGNKSCTKRDLLSIIGSLSHAAKVIRSGRAFLRRLIDLSKLARWPHHHLRLSREARSDLEWWFRFASSWSGISIMRSARKSIPEMHLTSDASGKWGCGAFYNQHWFQLKWVGEIEGAHITIKELVPVVIAAALWGEEWSGKTVQANCDNAAVVAILNSETSKDAEVMHLVRCLAFLKAKWEFVLVAAHIPGIMNDLADALSRDKADHFRSHYPQAQPTPAALPQELLDLTIIQKPDWTSPSWTELWSSIFRTA